MTAAVDRYLMLITSLPAHGALFDAKRPPLSRLRLRQRLRLLEPDDAEDLARLSALTDWYQLKMADDDVAVAQRARRLVPSIQNALTRDLAIWRLEIRTLIAALRRRQAGSKAPSSRLDWGFGRWMPHIKRHWNEPYLRLEGIFPWLPEAKRLHEQGDALGLERLLLGNLWVHLGRIAEGHHFDFEAVVIYCARWDLVARWTSYDGDAALARFDELVEASLKPLDAVREELVGESEKQV